jgi:hypothetical protein
MSNFFENADPLVVNTDQGSFGECPCGWRGEVMSEPEANSALNAHLTEEHPERRF